MGLVSITDIQSAKSLTGFQFNAVVSDNVDISGTVTSISRKVQAYRLKVDKLTRLDLFLNNFFGLRDSDISDQYITRFKGDMKMSVYIGADTLFASKTTLDDIDPDGDLVTAGAFKLAEYSYTEPEEGNIVNISQEYPERSIPVDLTTVKTEKSIVSSEVTLFVFVVTSGNVNILNASKLIKGSYIFNFAVRGSRFFFNKSGGLDNGFIYFQLPGQSDPSTLFGGTWSNISSDYAGCFFRAEGGNANAFEGGKQDFAMQGHFHQSYRDGSIAGGLSGVNPGGQNTANLTNQIREAISDGVNGTPKIANETRPVNHTIRIWKKTG